MILGLLGHPLSHSLSPRLYQAAFRFSQIEGQYHLFDIKSDCLSQWLTELATSGICGFNITLPHKQTLFEHIQSHTPEADLVGALNVVKVKDNGQLEGHNTDYGGFKFALEQSHGLTFTNQRALLLGSGGAALAAAAAIKDLGFTHIRVLARDPIKQQAFIHKLSERFNRQYRTQDLVRIESDNESLWHEPSLVINATSIGLGNEAPPDWMTNLIKHLPKACVCFDLVYRKDGSLPLFAKMAKEHGLKSFDGLDMLAQQARLSFQYWTDIDVPFKYMRAAI